MSYHTIYNYHYCSFFKKDWPLNFICLYFLTSKKSTYSFETFLPTTEYFKLFNFEIKIVNAQDYQKDINLVYEFKDLKIEWE